MQSWNSLTRDQLEALFVRQTVEVRSSDHPKQFAEDAEGNLYHMNHRGWVQLARPDVCKVRYAKSDGRRLPSIPFAGHAHLVRMAEQALSGLNKKCDFVKGSPRR